MQVMSVLDKTLHQHQASTHVLNTKGSLRADLHLPFMKLTLETVKMNSQWHCFIPQASSSIPKCLTLREAEQDLLLTLSRHHRGKFPLQSLKDSRAVLPTMLPSPGTGHADDICTVISWSSLQTSLLSWCYSVTRRAPEDVSSYLATLQELFFSLPVCSWLLCRGEYGRGGAQQSCCVGADTVGGSSW